MTIRGGPYALTVGQPTTITNPAVGQQTLYQFVVVYNYSSYLLAVENGGDQDWLQPGIAAAYELPVNGQPVQVVPQVLAGIPVVTTTCQAVFYTPDDGPPEGFPLTLPTAPGTTVVSVSGVVETISAETSPVVIESTASGAGVFVGAPPAGYAWKLYGWGGNSGGSSIDAGVALLGSAGDSYGDFYLNSSDEQTKSVWVPLDGMLIADSIGWTYTQGSNAGSPTLRVVLSAVQLA